MRYNFEVDCVAQGHRFKVPVGGAAFSLEEGKIDLPRYRPHLINRGYRPIPIPLGENCMAYVFSGQDRRLTTHVYNCFPNAGRPMGAVFCAALDKQASDEMVKEFLMATKATEAELDEDVLAVLRSTEESILMLNSDEPQTRINLG